MVQNNQAMIQTFTEGSPVHLDTIYVHYKQAWHQAREIVEGEQGKAYCVIRRPGCDIDRIEYRKGSAVITMRDGISCN